MARAHGRILASIWEDSDFTQLGRAEQCLYLFLLSQANLNYAGLLALTIRRWARKAADLTEQDLRRHLAALEAARFVLIDEDAEELLVRTFVRNDGLWRQPRMMGAMVAAASEISSVKLRRALLVEIGRLPVDELSDEPGPRGTSVREQISEHIAALRRTFGPLDQAPPTAPAAPAATPAAAPAPTLGATPGPGLGEPLAQPPTRAHTIAPARVAPAPTPSPTPAPEPREGGGEPSGTLRAAEPARPRPGGRHPIPDGFVLSDAMRRYVAKTFPALDADFETQQFVLHHRAEGNRKNDWHAEWQKWLGRSARYASERAHRQPPILHALPGGAPATFAPSSRTDQKVAAGLALAARLEAEERQAQ